MILVDENQAVLKFPEEALSYFENLDFQEDRGLLEFLKMILV